MLTTILLATLVGGCSGETDGAATGPISTQSGTTGVSPSASVAVYLEAIVVAESDPPNATGFLQSFDGTFSGTQVVQDSSQEVQSAVLDGWVDALTREFASPEAAEVIRGEAAANELDPKDHHFVGSIASAYEDPASARAALGAIVADIVPRVRGQDELDLGDGGVVFHDRFLGVPSLTYLWTNGRFLLVLGANGMDEDEIQTIAKGMDVRVRQQ